MMADHEVGGHYLIPTWRRSTCYFQVDVLTLAHESRRMMIEIPVRRFLEMGNAGETKVVAFGGIQMMTLKMGRGFLQERETQIISKDIKANIDQDQDQDQGSKSIFVRKPKTEVGCNLEGGKQYHRKIM
jgi:hypothetical protein